MYKTRRSRAASLLLIFCLILGNISSIGLTAFAAGEYTIPPTSEVFLLEGSAGNGKNTAEYLWIDETAVGAVFSVRADKKFTGGTITLSSTGQVIPLTFDTVLYDTLSVAGNTLLPHSRNDGNYVWQIAYCSVDSLANFDQIMLDITGPGGGFTINNYTYTLNLKYGMEISKTLIAVNDSSAGITNPACIGDKLTWEIKVTNSGDIALSDIEISDELSYSTGASAPGRATLSDSLPFALQPGESKTVTATYYVTEADAGYNLTNTATATASTGTHAHATCTVLILPTVTYHANGGEYAPSTQTKYPLQDLTLSNDIPTKPGYLFVSWNTDPSGLGTSYDPGALYTEDANLVLYAIWRIEAQYICSISAPDSITFSFNAQINMVWNPVTMLYEETVSGSWSKTTEISVTNLSNVEVNLTTEARLVYSDNYANYKDLILSVNTDAPGFTPITGDMYTGLTGTLKTNNTCSFSLEIRGTPLIIDTAILDPIQIGTLSVNIWRPPI